MLNLVEKFTPRPPRPPTTTASSPSSGSFCSVASRPSLVSLWPSAGPPPSRPRSLAPSADPVGRGFRLSPHSGPCTPLPTPSATIVASSPSSSS